MTNNDILRRLRYVFDFGDDTMIQLFGLGGAEVTRAQVSDWLKKEEDVAFEPCSDRELAMFLNGFIVKRRGKRDGPSREPEEHLSNNLILVKLKIALSFAADDMMEIMKSTGYNLSKHELSAFFRKPGHKHYRKCLDQMLRNFLNGLQLKYRPD